jgi:hypothetical protein
MQSDDVWSSALITWLTEKTLAGVSETDIVGGFCEGLALAGMPVARAVVLVDTLHPIYEGRAFRWNAGTDQAEMLEYGRTREGEPACAPQKLEDSHAALARKLYSWCSPFRTGYDTTRLDRSK